MPRPKLLSYALNKKTDKILDVNRRKKKLVYFIAPLGTAAFFMWWHFANNIDRYIDIWISPLAGAEAGMISRLDGFFLGALVIISVLLLCIFSIWNKLNEKFKKCKNEIIQILNVEPCYHSSPCTCKDDYCIWIEKEEHIDLI